MTPHTKVKLINDPAKLKWLIKKLELSDTIAFDLETTGLDPLAPGAAIVTLGVSWTPGEAAVIPVGEEWGKLAPIKRYLEDKSKKYVAHNGKFDVRWLAQFGIFVSLNFDTMIAAHLLDENRPKGLKPLSKDLLEAKDYELSKAEMRKILEVPIKRLALYNGRDCDYTLRLYHRFRTELRDEPRTARVFAKLMMPASHTFIKIEHTGIYVDKDRLVGRTQHAEKVVAKLTRYMGQFSNTEVNYNSPAQVGNWLFKDLGLPILEETNGGAPSTKESVLLQLAKEHKAVQALLLYRKWAKYLSTYLTPWARVLDTNSRIHPSYRLCGTVTGRLSSSDPNLQQVPRDNFIRGILGSRPGWNFVEADYSQIELRIAAMMAQEHKMLRAFHMGEDIHMMTACATTGKVPDDITKEERKKAKAINFGFLYGMGPDKFRVYARDNYGIEVTRAEAHQVRDKFFSTYPNLRGWHDRQRRLVQRYQAVQSPLGRVRHLPGVLSEDMGVRAEAERQAINSPVQGFASDLMLLSAVRLDTALSSKVARIVGSVHDALLFEIQDSVVDEILPNIRETMEDLGGVRRVFGTEITVPIEVEIKVGRHWSEGLIK